MQVDSIAWHGNCRACSARKEARHHSQSSPADVSQKTTQRVHLAASLASSTCIYQLLALLTSAFAPSLSFLSMLPSGCHA
jgi:hypothetical protein